MYVSGITKDIVNLCNKSTNQCGNENEPIKHSVNEDMIKKINTDSQIFNESMMLNKKKRKASKGSSGNGLDLDDQISLTSYYCDRQDKALNSGQYEIQLRKVLIAKSYSHY